MSANLNNPAAIPPKGVRAERGRFIAEAQVGGVGAWDWNPTHVTAPPPATLVPIKNTGSDPAPAYGAMVVTETSFGAALDDCIAAYNPGTPCSHGAVCTLGECSTWPADYGDIHTRALSFGPQLEGTTANAVPVPTDLKNWVVAAEAIPAGEIGMAYSGGVFFAMIWDADGYLGTCSQSLFVDLPQSLTGYNSSTDSDPRIVLPLRVRGNGRGRILWYDDNTTIGGASWPLTKARLALIERTQLFTYPTIQATITGSTALLAGRRWEYDWEGTHESSCTSAIVGKALNLCESANTEANVNGIPKTQLDACFGEDCWELQDLNEHGGQVILSIGLAADGSMQPMCQVMNQIIEKAC